MFLFGVCISYTQMVQKVFQDLQTWTELKIVLHLNQRCGRYFPAG